MSKLIKIITKHHYLFFVLLVGTVFRFWNISTNPPALNWDEISHGYNAFSILKTGKDEWGEFLPVIFRAYGDYKLPVYIYGVVPSIAIFGLNEFAVRFPSVLAGIGSVYFTYLLVKELLSSNNNPSRPPLKPKGGDAVAILSALLMAIEPWSLFLSRGAFEANLAQFFIISGVYFSLRSINHPEISLGRADGDLSTALKTTKNKSLKHFEPEPQSRWQVQNDRLVSRTTYYLPLATFLLGLSVWTYNSARVFVPLLVVSMVWIFRKQVSSLLQKNNKQRHIIHASLFIILLFLLPMFYQLANPVGSARYSKVEILDEGMINQINEGRNNSQVSPVLAKAIHNKATYFLIKFGENYISHFSPEYLFLEGGDQYQFSIPDNGLLYLVNLPFFYLGLVIVLAMVLRFKHEDITRRWGNRLVVDLINRRDYTNSNDNLIRRRNIWLVVVWLLLAPIPSSLTREAPHVLRSITFLPIPMILTAFGFVMWVNWIKSKLGSTFTYKRWRMPIFSIPRTNAWYVMYALFIIVSLNHYVVIYFGEYRRTYSWSWQYGYKQVVQYTKEHYDDYNKIIVTKKYGEPHEFFLFYNEWDPVSFRNDPDLIRFAQSDWFWVDAFDKYYFVNDWQVDEEGLENYTFELESEELVQCTPKMFDCLLITSPGNVPEGWDLLETVYFLDGQKAFELYEN